MMGKITEKKEAAIISPPESNNIAYCVKCKSKKTMKDAQPAKLKNGRDALSGRCETCSTKMFRIIGKPKPEGEE